MDGTHLCACFALPPNSRSYCGPHPFAKKFSAYLQSKSAKNRLALQSSLRKFKAHYAYLGLLADSNCAHPFDFKVAEAFWLGNPLLAKVKSKQIASLIQNDFTGKGYLPAKKARQLADGLPSGFLPHHTFHVLYLHSITGVIKPTVQNAENCRIGWGVATKIGNGWVELASQKLAGKWGNLKLINCKRRAKLSCAGITPVGRIKKGDIIATHWGIAVYKITKKQAATLEKCTLQNISVSNSLHK